LYAGAAGELRPLAAGDPVVAAQILRAGKDSGAVISLADGSRLELDKGTELIVQPENDGVRIGLETGTLIVRAAAQRDGHLHVRTRDCVVSVTGTVFTVNAGSSGSRVSVLEGEVHVLRGATLSILLPGEQVSTNPKTPRVPLEQEIEWSRDKALLATFLAVNDSAVLQKNGSIDGAVVDGVTGAPLPNASVRVYPGNGAVRLPSTVTTGTDGKFVFSNLPPGRQYIVVAEKDGYIRPRLDAIGSPRTELTLKSGQELRDVRLQLLPGGVVTGTILDENGYAIPNSRIFPLRFTFGEDGERIPVLVSSSAGITPGLMPSRDFDLSLEAPLSDRDLAPPGRANSRGEFRLFDLAPGSYVFYIVPPPPYVPSYYPDGASPSDARVVEVTGGTETRLNVITQRKGTGTIRARIVNPTGVSGGTHVEVRRRGSDYAVFSERARSDRNSESHPLVLGTYLVEALVGVRGDPPYALYGSTAAEVRGGAIDVDIAVNRGPMLQGFVVAESPSKAHRPIQGVRLDLMSRQIPLPISLKSSADGSFVLPSVPPGTFRIQSVSGIPEDMCLADVRQGTRNVQRHGIEVTDREVAIGVLLSESNIVVRGTVRDAGGQRVGESIVVLAPEEREASEMYAVGRTNQDGEFEIRCVRPGSFRLYAWRKLEGAAFRNAEFMKPYNARGKPVQIVAGGNASQKLTVLD
jgi:hypothetical protein